MLLNVGHFVNIVENLKLQIVYTNTEISLLQNYILLSYDSKYLIDI